MRRITAVTIAVLAAALTFAGGGPASAGGGCHSNVFSDEESTQVQLSKNCFEPTVVRVQPGQQVTWTSNDPEEHTVTGVANSWGADQKLHAGESVTYQFDATGVFPYFCYFHPSMVGAVVVGDGRAASAGTSSEDGVKAVSAEAPVGQADEADREAITETHDRDVAVPLILGVGVLAAGAGFAGAVVLRRRSSGSE